MSTAHTMPDGATAVFHGSRRTVVAHGLRPERDQRAHIGERLAHALDEGPGVVLGALGFDPARDARLVVPDRVVSAVTARRGVEQRAEVAARSRRDLGLAFRPDPSPEAFAEAVSRAVDRIEAGSLEKVVLSRSLVAEVPSGTSLRDLVRPVFDANPSAFAFAFDFGSQAAPHAFFGASPEMLIRRTGLAIRSVPLAGSLPRSADRDVDRRRAIALAESAKDLGEHRFVVDGIARALRPFCSELRVPDHPEVVATPTMWHLGTTIEGTLADRRTTAADLVLAIHPTPAVGGAPTADALDAIRDLEPRPRRLFAGPVGWTDRSGDGEWALGIRSAELAGRTLRLFAGAGVVADSDPDREVAETGAKFRTLLRAFGADDAGPRPAREVRPPSRV
ncbi:isochorismate synthase [Microbacterium karelineae]|uniref:isochorismate synthase n=1 Tax=Microbacterium karelineae TaxID=2654283 RepID=UPI0018D37C92|nr:isochorismate synthase [Microbacterium karelineae]